MQYVVGLGSNLGSRLATLRAALALIAQLPDVELQASSPAYRNPAVGPGEQPDYDNAAVRLESARAPADLLGELLAIERRLGRERRERWGARTLDLDLLWAPQLVRETNLRVPHPRLQERWFALLPLLDVAPELGASYGAALQAALPTGAAPRGRALSRAALASGGACRAPMRPADGLLRLSGAGDCREDALAEVLVALGRALGACGTVAESVVVDAGEGEPLAAACARIAAGFIPAEVSCGAGGARLSLLGERRDPPPRVQLRQARETHAAGVQRIEIDVAVGA